LGEATELTSAAVTEGRGVLQVLMRHARTAGLSFDAAGFVARAVSNLLAAQGSGMGAGGEVEAMADLLAALSSQLVAGVQPVVLAAPLLTSSVQKVEPTSTGAFDAQRVVFAALNTSLYIPPCIFAGVADPADNGTRVPTAVVQSTSYATNPLAHCSELGCVSDEAVELTIAFGNGTEMPVFNTSEPVSLTIGVVNAAANSSNLSCVYWDPNTTQWSEQGCDLVEFVPAQANGGVALVTCNCSHLSLFSVRDISVTQAPTTPMVTTTAATTAATMASTMASTVGATVGSASTTTTPTTTTTTTTTTLVENAVELTLGLPMSRAEFTEEKQTAVRSAVANAANTTVDKVSITSITSTRRRTSSVEVAMRVATTSVAQAAATASVLSNVTAINDNLAVAGLPSATLTSAPTAVQLTQAATTAAVAATPAPLKSVATRNPQEQGWWVTVGVLAASIYLASFV